MSIPSSFNDALVSLCPYQFGGNYVSDASLCCCFPITENFVMNVFEYMYLIAFL